MSTSHCRKLLRVAVYHNTSSTASIYTVAYRVATRTACYAPPLIGGCIKRFFSLTSVWPKSRTERPRKTKIGTEVVHVTRDSDTTFKVKRSKVKVTKPVCSPPYWRVRRLQRWAWERVGCGKLLLRCRLLGGGRRFGARGGRRGAGHTLAAARLQLVAFWLGWNYAAVTLCSKQDICSYL